MFYWPEVWIPMMMQPQVEDHSWLDNRSTWNTELLGRLKPGANRVQAMADLNRIAGDLARQYPLSDKGLHIRLAEPGFLGSSIRGAVAAFTAGVFLLAGLVLLVACSNLGGLLLARVTDRQREVAIRYSIGAGRLRIVSQLLAESLVLALLGGAAGCLLAIAACKIFSSWHAPVDFPVQLNVQVGWRVLAFAAVASLVTGLLFGLAPALRLLDSMRMRLLEGRDFNDHDAEHSPPVAIVNQALARQILGTADPVGHTFRYSPGLPPVRVIGLVADDNILGFALFPMHASAISLSAFGALALLLTVTGIYGLVDYSVARRTNELGIRIAVGAGALELLRLLLARLILLVSAGLAFGLLLSWLAAPALSAIIYTAEPRDPAVMSSVLLALLAAALVSCWKPVTRGLRVNPVSALRCD